MQKTIKSAVEILRRGGVIIYPTDTIWGIGCDATNSEAVERIYKLKKREDSKSMLLLVDNPNMIYQYVDKVPDIAWDLIELADKPLTIIYPNAKNLPPSLIASDGSIGIRVVKHAFCQGLIQTLRRPIVSTSANVSGKDFPKNVEEIEDEIFEGADFCVPIEFDLSTNPSPSSIIKLGVNGEVKLIRK